MMFLQSSTYLLTGLLLDNCTNAKTAAIHKDDSG